MKNRIDERGMERMKELELDLPSSSALEQVRLGALPVDADEEQRGICSE